MQHHFPGNDTIHLFLGWRDCISSTLIRFLLMVEGQCILYLKINSSHSWLILMSYYLCKIKHMWPKGLDKRFVVENIYLIAGDYTCSFFYNLRTQYVKMRWSYELLHTCNDNNFELLFSVYQRFSTIICNLY